jgi:hypothetical protein
MKAGDRRPGRAAPSGDRGLGTARAGSAASAASSAASAASAVAPAGALAVPGGAAATLALKVLADAAGAVVTG